MGLPYARLFQTMPCYLTVQDRDLRIIEANERFREDFGDFEGRYCYQLYKRQSERCASCPVLLTFRDGQGHHGEETLQTANGKHLAVMVYTTPVRDGTGQIEAVMEMATDITETALVREQLHESQMRHRLLFEEVPCYISIQDRDLRILEVNRRFREDFGDVPGAKCFHVYKHRDKECLICPVQQTFQDGQIHHSEEVVTSRQGEQMNVLVYAAPLRDTEGRIHSVMEMSANITEIRELESQLTSLGLLVGTISHGIKGLLTGLDGGKYLLNTGLQKNDPKRIEKGWDMVRRNVDQIRSMVLNILFYAKDRELDWQRVSAPSLAREVADLLEKQAEDRAVESCREIDEQAGELEADPQALRSMLINLLENSLDACMCDEKKEHHRIGIRLRGQPDRVAFEVEDNGVGMDQETREKAFSLFFSSKGTKGTGLGLFISNKIALAHGGVIHLESEIDKGCRFVVELPRRRPERAGVPTD
jgi:PAS domain S-box-containing protein